MSAPTFLDTFDVVEAYLPVDGATAGATGDWVSMKNAYEVVIIAHSAVGTAGEDPTFALLQASTNTGTGSKALAIPPSRVFKKQAATSLASTTAWADASGDIVDDADDNTLTNTDMAEQDTILAISVHPSDLDTANGFDHVSFTIADDITNPQLVTGYYIVRKAYQSPPASNTGHL